MHRDYETANGWVWLARFWTARRFPAPPSRLYSSKRRCSATDFCLRCRISQLSGCGLIVVWHLFPRTAIPAGGEAGQTSFWKRRCKGSSLRSAQRYNHPAGNLEDKPPHAIDKRPNNPVRPKCEVSNRHSYQRNEQYVRLKKCNARCWILRNASDEKPGGTAALNELGITLIAGGKKLEANK